MIRADQGSEFVSRDLDLWAYLRQAVLPPDPFERLDDIRAFELETRFDWAGKSNLR